MRLSTTLLDIEQIQEQLLVNWMGSLIYTSRGILQSKMNLRKVDAAEMTDVNFVALKKLSRDVGDTEFFVGDPPPAPPKKKSWRTDLNTNKPTTSSLSRPRLTRPLFPSRRPTFCKVN